MYNKSHIQIPIGRNANLASHMEDSIAKEIFTNKSANSVPHHLNNLGCLDKLINKDLQKYGSGVSQIDYIKDLRRVLSKYQNFATSNRQKESHLILGKVQSGKTAHMLYTIAWAVDNRFDAILVFTGGTKSLNNQTIYRMETEIGLGSANRCVEVLEVSTKEAEDKKAVSRIISQNNIPLLISLKNSPRAKVAKALLNSLGEYRRVMIIDDEADYISQDGNSYYLDQKESSKVHTILASIYEDNSEKTLWISYTATPQAVLLTDRQGKLRPDFCSVINPRTGYFGLNELIARNFCSVVTSWNNSAVTARDLEFDDELRVALWDGLFSAAILMHSPEFFYGMQQVQKINKSVQVLLHTSNRQIEHAEYKEATSKVLDSILESIINREGEHTRNFSKYIAKSISLNPSLEAIKESVVLSDNTLIDIIKETKIIIFNSEKENSLEERPVSDSDYNKHPLWIIIGGDIVGRGVTLPTLTVSYHLRDSKKPNFDTVMQQLRICGYREECSHMIRFYTTKEVEIMLEDMMFTDMVLWNQVSQWDKEKLNLKNAEGLVFFISSNYARYAPTSKNKQDRNTVSYNVSEAKETMFSLKTIFSPINLNKNMRLVQGITEKLTPRYSEKTGKSWFVLEGGEYHEIIEKWAAYDHRDKKQINLLQTLLGMPSSLNGNKIRHLEDQAIIVLIAESTLEIANAIIDNRLREIIKKYDATNYPMRLGRNGALFADINYPVTNIGGNLTEIKTLANANSANSTNSVYDGLRLVTPHIGTPQRNLINDDRICVEKDALYLIIEPLIATKPKAQSQIAEDLALGIAFSGLYRRTNSDRLDIKMVVHD